jgi:four helix bundle protein
VRPARHFSDLIAWQLADEIRHHVFALSARPGLADDLKAKRQMDDAASSVCRNIAEGFGCDSNLEFARYLGFSRRSLNELLDALRGARQQNYATAQDLAPILSLARRLYPAIGRLAAHLRANPRTRSAKPNPR